MSYAAIISGVIGAAGSIYSANQQKKAAQSAARGNSASFQEVIDYAKKHPEAFGSKPDSWESVDYTPLFRSDPGYAALAGQVISGNTQNLPASIDLVRAVNAYATEDARTRINSWDPTFESSFAQQQQNTANMLAGRLPWEDIQSITARRSELNSILGGAGTSQQTAADLGLTRLQLMQQGERSLNANADLIGRIDPFARRMMPQSMFVDVNQALGMAVQENWNDYQAAARERDAAFAYEMMADPYHQGMLNLYAGAAGIQGAGNAQIAAAQQQAAAGQNQMFQSFANLAGQLVGSYLGGGNTYGTSGAWGTSYSDPARYNMSDRPTGLI